MEKKKKVQKERKPRKDFAQRLAEKLRQLGNVDEGSLGDNSGRWVNLKIGEIELSFSFDMKGEMIDRIGLYKDVIQVVDQEKVWGIDK